MSESRASAEVRANEGALRNVQSVLVPHTMDIVKKTNMLLKLSNTNNNKDNTDLNGVMLD